MKRFLAVCLGLSLIGPSANRAACQGPKSASAAVKRLPHTRAAGVADLTEALKSSNRDVRFYTACALVQIEPGNEAAHGVLKAELSALGTLLQAEDVKSRVFAANVLRCLGADAEAAVPILFHGRPLAKSDAYAMRNALEAIGPAAVPFLSKALKERDNPRKAVGILARIGPEVILAHEVAVQALTEAVKDRNKHIRRPALLALGRPAAVWVEVLKDTDNDFCWAAAEALDHYRECGRALLVGKRWEQYYRCEAARALVGVGPDAKAVVPDLTEALKDPNRDVRFYAACALIQIEPGNKAAAALLVGELPVLIELLKDGDGQRVAFAADVLGCLGAKAEPAVPALRDVVAHPRQWAVPGGAATGALMKIRQAARAEEDAPAFSLSYNSAGLAEVSVKGGKLRYIWHTLRHWDEGEAKNLGSLENYDRHEIDVWLTDIELGRFRDWIGRHKVFEFDQDYPSSLPPGLISRASAYESRLTVARGDKKHRVSWVGDSKIPKGLATAKNELLALAGEIQKSRSK
jgi:HEAT repeat protein